MRITKGRVTSVVFLFIGLLVLRYFTFPGARLVFGRVTDSVTGKSVRGVNVALIESHYEGWAVQQEVLRATHTNRFGWFLLLPAFRWLPPFPFSGLRSIWLTVNEDANGSSGGEEGSAETVVLYNPILFNSRNWPIGDSPYFPKTITPTPQGCDRVWNATCSFKPFWWGISISLVPVLSDFAGCRKIRNSSLQEQCRQLNTYHAAFVHADSYPEVQQDKQLCSDVDHGIISRTCLQVLAGYARSPAKFLPIPQGMFPDTLAGLPVMNNKHCGPQLSFSGRVMCAAGYGASISEELVAVYIETYPGTHENIQASQWRPTYTDYKQATVIEEMRFGSKILCYHGPMYDSYLWYSGEKHVEVFFYHHIRQESQFVSYYLQRFPSTLQ